MPVAMPVRVIVALPSAMVLDEGASVPLLVSSVTMAVSFPSPPMNDTLFGPVVSELAAVHPVTVNGTGRPAATVNVFFPFRPDTSIDESDENGMSLRGEAPLMSTCRSELPFDAERANAVFPAAPPCGVCTTIVAGLLVMFREAKANSNDVVSRRR
jgi:hypothetical protein